MLFSILAGCYDGTLHGWQTDTDEVMDVELAFAFRAHDTCVRTVAVSGKLACTASTDESIQTYDICKRKVSDRMLGVHQDEVTALSFSVSNTGDVFLLSGDREGRIYVWATARNGADCHIIHELKGHKQSSPVTSISVHPSGKIALSTAKDNSLRMWDLTLGKAAPRTKLEDFTELGYVCWSPKDGARYGLVGDGNTVLIFDTLSGSETPIGVFKHPKRVNALCFCEDVVLASACDDGALRTLGADGSLLREFRATTEDKLIRARDCKSATVGSQVLLIGAFSDNTIRIWDVAGEDDEQELKILHVGSRSHITCLDVFAQQEEDVTAEQEQPAKKKAKVMAKKRIVAAGDDESEDSEEEAAAPKPLPPAKIKQEAPKKPQETKKKKNLAPAAPVAAKPRVADDIVYVKQSNNNVVVQPPPQVLKPKKKEKKYVKQSNADAVASVTPKSKKKADSEAADNTPHKKPQRNSNRGSKRH